MLRAMFAWDPDKDYEGQPWAGYKLNIRLGCPLWWLPLPEAWFYRDSGWSTGEAVNVEFPKAVALVRELYERYGS